MLDESLTDDEIAALCDIGEAGFAQLSKNKSRLIEGLMFAGYVELADGSGVKLTAKATEFLTKRGVGLNES